VRIGLRQKKKSELKKIKKGGKYPPCKNHLD